jgi:hypothetical protein
MDVDVAAFRRRYQERTQTRRRGEPPPPYQHVDEVVAPGPTGETLADRRAAAAEAYVRAVRHKVFGSSDPPFSSRADEACMRWETARLSGKMDPDADRMLDGAEAAVARGTGFDERQVYEWILTGARPRLPRAVLRVERVREILPDGTQLGRKWAALVVHAPITEAEMRRAWRLLNAGWRDPKAGPVFAAMAAARRRPPRAPRLSVLDRHLLALVRDTPGATWVERLDVWRRTPPQGWTSRKWRTAHGNVTGGALAVRHHRLTRKLEEIDGGTGEWSTEPATPQPMKPKAARKRR